VPQEAKSPGQPVTIVDIVWCCCWCCPITLFQDRRGTTLRNAAAVEYNFHWCFIHFE